MFCISRGPRFHCAVLIGKSDEIKTTAENFDASSYSTHHGAVDLAEAGRAEDVEQQLLLDAGPHPQEELQSRLQQVDSALGQPLLGVPHRQWQRAALQLHLEESVTIHELQCHPLTAWGITFALPTFSIAPCRPSMGRFGAYWGF